jgi:hypothetical protein
MSSLKYLNTRLNRRSWVALAVSTLSGCGGGGSDTAGLPGTGGTGDRYPGTGGTGIFQGAITGFGSLIMNGVTYDNSKAVMHLDGVEVSQDILRLGMVASIRGEHTTGTATGIASSVEVWAIAQGQVSEVGASHFNVAGMRILTSAATWFYDLPSPLSNGAYVSVWGLQADTEGETWTATCVQASSETAGGVSSGLVKVENAQRSLNDLRLSGAVANTLAEGVLMRVQGTWVSLLELNVLSAQPISGSVPVQAQASGEVEIEGLVTTAPTASGFKLGDITVDTRTSVYEPVGAAIVLGARVEVYGHWENGLIKATKVELEDVQSHGEVAIKAPFQQFSSTADFVMQGQRCNATGVVLNARTQAALPRSGVVTSDIFKVKGSKNGDWLMVTSLELDH